MNSTASESHQAGAEARRAAHSHGGHSTTGVRYDALLRYLRGLYVRPERTSTTTVKQERPPAGPGTATSAPAEAETEPAPDEADSER